MFEELSEKMVLSLIYSMIFMISFMIVNKGISNYFQTKKSKENTLKLFEENKGKLKIIFLNNINKTFIIHYSTIEHINWFFTNFLKFEIKNKNFDKEGYVIYETEKDFNLIKSLINTVLFKFPIIYDINHNIISINNNTSSNYNNTINNMIGNLIELKSLAIEYSCEKDIINIIDDKLKEYEEDNKKYFDTRDKIINNFPQQCKICNQGFIFKNNKNGCCNGENGIHVPYSSSLSDMILVIIRC